MLFFRADEQRWYYHVNGEWTPVAEGDHLFLSIPQHNGTRIDVPVVVARVDADGVLIRPVLT